MGTRMFLWEVLRISLRIHSMKARRLEYLANSTGWEFSLGVLPHLNFCVAPVCRLSPLAWERTQRNKSWKAMTIKHCPHAGRCSPNCTWNKRWVKVRGGKVPKKSVIPTFYSLSRHYLENSQGSQGQENLKNVIFHVTKTIINEQNFRVDFGLRANR